MMDFLRGLAPAHADARHRAVVAPRSRYEIDQPIGAIPRAAASEVEHDERHASMPEPANRSVRPIELDDVSSPLVTHDSPRPRLTREPVDAAFRPPAAAIVARPELEAAVKTIPVEGHALPPASATSPQRSLVLPAVGQRLSHAVGEPVRTAVPTGRERVALASRPEQRSVDRGPLSQRALASRVVPQGDRPPIVHVTIDRVDVRAPAAPERPAPRTRSRTATTGSLTDYLRARPAGRQGGTS